MKTLWATCLLGVLSHLSYAQPTPAEEQLGPRDAQAKRQAEAAIALLQLGQYKTVWPLLKQRADPSLRSYLIRDMGRAGLLADVVINQIKTEKDASIRRALLLTLGGFSDKQLPEFKRKPLVSWLLQLYRTDPDPGIHSAIDWLLRAGQRNPTRNGQFMKRINGDERCPQVFITWFEAAQYCNWLSQQEGIPKEQWCYPTLAEIKEGMALPADYLHRTGYRMPTEAEWEYASRAGAATSRFFGQSDELLKEYAWYTGTSFNERQWPVGQLKPNDFGLFDVYGNVWEWGQDWVKQYQSESGDKIWVDTEDTILTVSKNYKRPRKGGSFTYNADFMRSALRNDGYIPDERRDSVGFRVARTSVADAR